MNIGLIRRYFCWHLEDASFGDLYDIYQLAVHPQTGVLYLHISLLIQTIMYRYDDTKNNKTLDVCFSLFFL